MHLIVCIFKTIIKVNGRYTRCHKNNIVLCDVLRKINYVFMKQFVLQIKKIVNTQKQNGHVIQGPPNIFFLENALEKLLNSFSNFFFYLKVQSFRLIMENNLNGCLDWSCISLHDRFNF